MPQFCSYANEADMAVLIQTSSFDPEADNSHLPPPLKNYRHML